MGASHPQRLLLVVPANDNRIVSLAGKRLRTLATSTIITSHEVETDTSASRGGDAAPMSALHRLAPVFHPLSGNRELCATYALITGVMEVSDCH
jgi:hypothetical protein